MFVLQEINPNVKNIKPLDYSFLVRRATQITKELGQVMRKILTNNICNMECSFQSAALNSTFPQGTKMPFQEVIDVSTGDLHRAGVKPLTFVRQVIYDLCVCCQSMSSLDQNVSWHFSRYLHHVSTLSFWTATHCQQTSSRGLRGSLEDVLEEV